MGIPNVEGHGEREESKGAEVTPELESLGRGKERYSEVKQNLVLLSLKFDVQR